MQRLPRLFVRVLACITLHQVIVLLGGAISAIPHVPLLGTCLCDREGAYSLTSWTRSASPSVGFAYNMVRRQLKRQRPPDLTQATVAGDKHAPTQVDLYRILTQRANLFYACPLCLNGYSRYDYLYDHFKNTEEEHHEALKSLWFSDHCTVCHEPAGQGTLKHSKHRHPESYQVLMKSTLRLRPEVNVTIPAAPDCFRHEFFFPLRERTSIISCPPKKRKTAKHTARQDTDEYSRAGSYIGSPSLPITGPADPDLCPLTAHEPLLCTEMHGMGSSPYVECVTTLMGI